MSRTMNATIVEPAPPPTSWLNPNPNPAKYKEPNFPWQLPNPASLGITESDLAILNLHAPIELFKDAMDTQVFAAVLALMYEDLGYVDHLWNSPSIRVDYDETTLMGFLVMDTPFATGLPRTWARTPARQECLVSLQLWATTRLTLNTLQGHMNQYALRVHQPYYTVERSVLQAIAYANKPLALHLGWVFRASSDPFTNIRQPVPWSEVQKIYN